MTLIRVSHLYHDYVGKGDYVVRDVSFEIAEGEIFGFLGPSGAGKTTTQNIMIGLLPVQRGEVLYENRSIKEMAADFFNRIGVSFEHPNLYSRLTGYENLKYFAGLFGVATLHPMKLLDMVGLKEAAHRRTETYSKGMKQRLVFARSLLNNPRILFLDEPTASLDPVTAERIKHIILQKKQEACTIFLTTHNMYVAEELCDRVAFLNKGEIVAMDAPGSLKLRYGEKSVKVEYRSGEGSGTEVFFLDDAKDRESLHRLLDTGDVLTIHSQEATLEQVFIKLTGRKLS